MADVTSGFESGTNGNTLSTGDAGDATAFDSIVIDGSGAIVYDTAHVHGGSLAMKETTWGSSSSTGTGIVWTSAGGLSTATDHYGRIYVYLTSISAANLIFMQFASAATRNVRFQLTASTGTLAFVDSPGSGTMTTTTAVATNQWVRIEWHVIHSATVGQVELKLFNTPESSTPTETLTGSSNYNTGTAAGGVHIGSVGNTPDGFVYWIDDVVVNATSYPGPSVTAVQTLAPTTDSVDGSWTDQSGGSSLFAAIDEASFSDADYIQSELSPSASGCRVKLASGGDPASSSGHEINWRAGKSATGGQTVNMTVKLYQGGGNSLGGGTLIADFDRNAVDALTTYTETLSGGEADSITNYADLYLEFWATV